MIGCEVYNRDKDYNPALDPIVRVGAHGLRKKLEAYNNGEGKDDEIILEIPVGSYIPIFSRRSGAIALSGSEITFAESSKPSDKLWIGGLILTIVLLFITIFVLAYFNSQLREQLQAGLIPRKSADVFRPVWETFIRMASRHYSSWVIPRFIVFGARPIPSINPGHGSI